MPKISAFPTPSTSLAKTDVLPVVVSGATRKISLDTLTAGRSLKWYGSESAAGTALETAEDAAPTGIGVNIPTGTFALDKATTLDANRMNLQGAGRQATVLTYNSSNGGPAITVNNSVSTSGYNQGRIGHLGFSSNNSTAKTFLDLYNVANFEAHHLACTNATWPGDSIGIRTRGRQMHHIHHCELACNRPIVISPNSNPTYATLCTDHSLFEYCELVGQDSSNPTTTPATRPVIEIESGVMLTNTIFRNLAIAWGNHGIYWNDTGAAIGTSYQIVVDQCRIEQSKDWVNGWSLYFANTNNLIQDIRIVNCYLDTKRHGVYIRNAQNITIENTTIASEAGKTAIDVTLVAGSRLTIKNVYVQTGATVVIANARCVSRTINTSTNLRDEVWVYDSGTGYDEGTVETSAYFCGGSITLAAGATQTILENLFNGFVEVTYPAAHTGALYFIRGTAGTTKVMSFSDAGWYGETAGAANINIYLSGGAYVIQNNTGISATLRLLRRGATT